MRMDAWSCLGIAPRRCRPTVRKTRRESTGCSVAQTAEREGPAPDKRWQVRKDGSLFFADGVMVALRSHQGALRGFSKIFRDATCERRALDALCTAEESLRQSRDWLSALLNSSGEGIYGSDADGVCTFFNPAGAQMLGYAQHELVGSVVHDLIQQHHVDGTPYPVAECRIRRAAEAGSFLRVDEDVFWQRDGTAIRVAYSVSPIVVRGCHRGAVVTFTNISRRRLAEERLKEVLRIRTVGILFWGPDFGLTDMNEAFLRMSGYSREEALGKTWQEMTPIEFHPESLKAVHDVMTLGEATPYEKEYIRKDGTRWWGLFASRKVGNEVVEFVLDVTERRRAEAALREADRRKDEFLATLAHELRNPMAPLRNGLHIARLTTSGSDATDARHDGSAVVAPGAARR